MNKLKVFFLFLSLIALYGCSSTKKLSSRNLSFIYQNEKNSIRANFGVYHKDAVNSELQFSINSTDLLYAKNLENNDFVAKVGVSYMLMKSYDENTIVDSATIWLTDTNNEKLPKIIYGKVPLKIAYPNKSILVVTVKDAIKKKEEQRLVVVNKSDFVNHQNFMVYDTKTNLPILNRYFTKGDAVGLKYQYKSLHKIYVEYFNREFDLPAPPFSNQNPKKFDYSPDSTFTIEVEDSSSFEFKMANKGFYIFKTLKSARYGITLFCFDDNFPNVKTPEDMIEPIRYISSNKEYQTILETENTKQAIDNFWLDIAETPNEARVLIKNYYHRIEECNRYFSSYLPGWKTDRGMIFTIFGPPNVIYKDDITETWIFGDENTPLSLTFYFLKVDNPFTDNDFRLTRSPIFKNPWYGMVDRWRKGKIVDQY